MKCKKKNLTLCFIVTKFCVLACLIIWMHKQFLLILTVAVFIFSPTQKFCVVYLNLTDNQMKA